MKTSCRFHSVILCFFLIAFASMVVSCGGGGGDDNTPTTDVSNNPDPDTSPKLSVAINSVETDECPNVNVYVNVIDENNQIIADDAALSLKVIEDGVEQNNNLGVTWLADGSDSIAVVLALDYSLSMIGDSREANMKKAVKEFVARMKPEDRAAIIKFYYTPQVMVGLTSDKDALNDAIDEPPISNMYTNIYDTLYAAVDLLAAETDSVAVILITDGGHSMTQVEGYLPPEEYAREDGLTWAGHSLDEALAHANDEQVPVYTIGYINKSQNHDEIKEIAAQTGGAYYSADDADALNSIYGSLFTCLEGNQHQIVYTSDTADDQEHTLSVEAEYNGILGASSNVNFKLCPAASH